LKRAITDEGVATVFDLAKQAGLSNVSIICTKADVRLGTNLFVA
jgi:tRNA G46 methylase TrmB